MSFTTARPGYKKREAMNITCQSRSTKEKRSFQTGGYMIKDESYLDGNKCKCANEMSLSASITVL